MSQYMKYNITKEKSGNILPFPRPSFLQSAPSHRSVSSKTSQVDNRICPHHFGSGGRGLSRSQFSTVPGHSSTPIEPWLVTWIVDTRLPVHPGPHDVRPVLHFCSQPCLPRLVQLSCDAVSCDRAPVLVRAGVGHLRFGFSGPTISDKRRTEAYQYNTV